jgi:uncharacterized protein involved in oxidation of intracellular sulfur
MAATRFLAREMHNHNGAIDMTTTLFIINDAPYGNERAYNALRLAGALVGREDQQVRVFLLADAVGCAKAGQMVPEGYYNVQLMLGKVLRKGAVALCGTCMDARGLIEADMAEGTRRSTLAELAQWTAEADKVLVF